MSLDRKELEKSELMDRKFRSIFGPGDIHHLNLSKPATTAREEQYSGTHVLNPSVAKQC